MLNTSEECRCVMRKTEDMLRRDEDDGHRQRQKLGPWDLWQESDLKSKIDGVTARAAGCKIGTLGPLASISLKTKNSWYDSRGCKVQKLGL